jgi:hypothetical protein
MSFKFIYQRLRFIYVPILKKFPRLNPHTTFVHEKPTYNVGGVCVNTSVKWRSRRFTKAFNKTWDTIEKFGVANRNKFYAGSEWKCRNAVWAAITAKKNKSGGGGVSFKEGLDF